MRIEVAGGEPRTICDAGVPRGGSWSSDGEIVFARFRSALSRVSASGGNPVPLTKVDRAVGDLATTHLGSARRPVSLLPAHCQARDAGRLRGVTVEAGRANLAGRFDVRRIFRPDGSAPGVLLYVNGTTLFAQPFDPTRSG